MENWYLSGNALVSRVGTLRSLAVTVLDHPRPTAWRRSARDTARKGFAVVF